MLKLFFKKYIFILAPATYYVKLREQLKKSAVTIKEDIDIVSITMLIKITDKLLVFLTFKDSKIKYFD